MPTTIDLALNKALEVSESDIQKQIIEYLNLKGHYVWRNNTGGTPYIYKGKQRFIHYGKKGSSDILGVAKDGKIIAIEVKRPGNNLTPEQTWFLGEINGRGGYGIFAYSLDDVIRFGL